MRSTNRSNAKNVIIHTPESMAFGYILQATIVKKVNFQFVIYAARNSNPISTSEFMWRAFMKIRKIILVINVGQNSTSRGNSNGIWKVNFGNTIVDKYLILIWKAVWVLKSKIVGQKSTYLKEIVVFYELGMILENKLFQKWKLSKIMSRNVLQNCYFQVRKKIRKIRMILDIQMVLA